MPTVEKVLSIDANGRAAHLLRVTWECGPDPDKVRPIFLVLMGGVELPQPIAELAPEREAYEKYRRAETAILNASGHTS